jgi:hypothetical protein
MLALDSNFGAPSIITDAWAHEWYSSWEGYHNYIDGIINTDSTNKNATFLAVIYPERTGIDFPQINYVELADGSPCIAVYDSENSDIMASQISQSVLTINETGFNAIETDGTFFWLSVDSSGRVVYAVLMGGTYLNYNNSKIISHDLGTPVSAYNQD